MSVRADSDTSIQARFRAAEARLAALESSAAVGARVLWELRSADMNDDADQAFTKVGTFETYIITGIRACNASTSLTTAEGGIYTDEEKGGIAVVAADAAWTALTGATIGADMTVTAAGKDELDADALYLSLGTEQGGAATADILVYGFATS